MSGSFTDEQSRAAWNQGARAWDAFVESGADYYRLEVHGPALLDACGPVAGMRVLDLGCGQGYFTRALARSGAAATGVDLSDELIALARAHEARAPAGVRYEHLGAAEVAGRLDPASFDLVTGCMSLQDMADVPAVLRDAARVLRRGGRLVFSVPHPFSDMPFREWERDRLGRKRSLRVDRYFETGPATCDWTMPRLQYRWQTPYWRFTLEEWSGMIDAAGLRVAGLREPRPTPEQVARRPELEDCARVPYFLIFDLVRPG